MSTVFCNHQSPVQPRTSNRIRSTDDPTIAKTKQLVSEVPGTLSLAQGVVHWQPPQPALARAASMISEPSASAYGPDEGMPALRQALRKKIANENGLQGYDVHVTAGCNQAFANLTISLLDPEDTVILFLPYYFNHRMAIQMTGGADSIVYGPCDPYSFHPDLDWLEKQLLGSSTRPRMVVIVNPNNPTGVLMSKEECQRAADLCAAGKTWLVMDNTYEHFVYEGREHHCIGGPHIIHLFSFSKAFGMMGWRQGYIAFPEDHISEVENTDSGLAAGGLGAQFIKVQDTVPICATQLSQHVSIGALEAGREWVMERVAGLDENRRAVLEALSPLGTMGNGIAPSEGAIYLWARLPAGFEDDETVVEWLVRKHKVCLIPGTACGCPGYVRVAFANLQKDDCKEAARRLKEGLKELADCGMAIVMEDIVKLR